MTRIPPRRRARLWAWVYAVIFGEASAEKSDEDGADARAEEEAATDENATTEVDATTDHEGATGTDGTTDAGLVEE